MWMWVVSAVQVFGVGGGRGRKSTSTYFFLASWTTAALARPPPPALPSAAAIRVVVLEARLRLHGGRLAAETEAGDAWGASDATRLAGRRSPAVPPGLHRQATVSVAFIKRTRQVAATRRRVGVSTALPPRTRPMEEGGRLVFRKRRDDERLCFWGCGRAGE